VLYSFAGGSDGSKPESAVIMDAAGNFYGTTALGGSNCDCGTVYKLAPNGTETILHVFTGGNDGAQPYAALVADQSGNLYGTTVIGGVNEDGTVFKIAPDGTEKVLHTFSGGDDGEQPYAGLILDKNGNLFGAAIGGGVNGFGVVYELTPKGTFKVPYAFTGGSQAAYPEGTLLADKSGNFYGTTRGGGTGSGTVYQLSADFHEKVLYAFTNGSDGSEPYAGVVADKSGNLYGAAVGGGGAGGFGTVFKVAKNGAFTLLHDFTGDSDGAYPEGGVITSNSHTLFGVAYAGGPLWGTVFKLPQ
jgi:uncharacterized repeat protein (TIGR03803 family)